MEVPRREPGNQTKAGAGEPDKRSAVGSVERIDRHDRKQAVCQANHALERETQDAATAVLIATSVDRDGSDTALRFTGGNFNSGRSFSNRERPGLL